MSSIAATVSALLGMTVAYGFLQGVRSNWVCATFAESRPTNQANLAFHPFGVHRWVVRCNWMSPTSVTGGAIWWKLTKERQAWCIWVDCSNKYLL